jgi:hypothetical protein
VADSSAVPCMGLAAQVATHPERAWDERAWDGEALLGEGIIAAPPTSSATAARTAASRRATGLLDIKDFTSSTSSWFR